MVKRTLLTLLQFFAFCGLLMVGGYWDVIRLLLQLRTPALNVIPLWKIQISVAHDLILNGIVFATLLLLVILLLELWRKAVRPWIALSMVAFVVAVILSLILKVGMPPTS